MVAPCCRVKYDNQTRLSSLIDCHRWSQLIKVIDSVQTMKMHVVQDNSTSRSGPTDLEPPQSLRVSQPRAVIHSSCGGNGPSRSIYFLSFDAFPFTIEPPICLLCHEYSNESQVDVACFNRSGVTSHLSERWPSSAIPDLGLSI